MKIEKLLQALVMPKAQRVQMALGLVASLIIFVPLFWQLQVEHSRTQFPALDPANLSYCEPQGCRIHELGGLEVTRVEITEQKWATFVEVQFVNPGRLIGDREFYLELINENGEIAEAAKTNLKLSPKGQIIATFSFQRTPEVLLSGSLRLAF